MDDNIPQRLSIVPKLVHSTKYQILKPSDICEVAKPMVKPMPKPVTETSSFSKLAPCLIKSRSLLRRHVAIKSINNREVIATAFTRAGAYRKARRKGFNSCRVIYMPKQIE